VVFDSAGNLYGTTGGGGASNDGTVFELAPPAAPGDPWTETIIHSFNGSDGSNIRDGVVFDQAGNLYGTAFGGGTGSPSDGTVFELSPPLVAGGTWTETTLTSFTGGTGGGQPYAGVLVGPQGTVFGTTSVGGLRNCYSYGCGVVFEIKP
jgi:uncharacterized repeat protein (TIGR03803 family)